LINSIKETLCAFFADITRSELLLEYRRSCQSRWRLINHEIVSISIIKNQNCFC